MMLPLSRRAFIGSIAALVGAGLAPPVLAAGRKPFVEEGEYVSSIVWHMWDRPRPPCSISMLVHEVMPWDGTGYPIILAQTGWRKEDRILSPGWYDFEWSNLLRDVPKDFWRTHSTDQYPNVHSYVREQRFGESPEVMRRTMARNQAERVQA